MREPFVRACRPPVFAIINLRVLKKRRDQFGDGRPASDATTGREEPESVARREERTDKYAAFDSSEPYFLGK